MPARSLVQAYTNLSPTERHVTHLCALAGEALKPNTLAKLSKAAGWSNRNGKKLLQADARTTANKLVRNSVLRQATYSGVVINPDVQDLAVQDCIREGWFDKLAGFLQEKFPRSSYGYNQAARMSRDLRIAFYGGDVDTFKLLAVHSSKTDGPPQMLDPFSQDIYDRLDPILQEMYLIDVIPRMIGGDDGCLAAFQAFEKLADSQTKPSDDFAACAIDVYVAGGQLASLRTLDQRTGGKIVEIAGCEAFLRGDYDDAETCFAAAIPTGERSAKKSKTALRHLPAVLYVLLLLKQHSAEARVRAFQLLNAVAKARGGKYTGVTKVLSEAAMFQQTPCPPAEFIAALKQACNSDLALLLAGYVWTWSLTEEDAKLDVTGLAQAAKSYEQLGLSWLAAEAAGLAGKMPLKSATTQADKCGHMHDQLGTKSLVDAVRPAPVWERALTAISQLGAGQQQPSVSTSGQAAERMIWEISYSTRYPNVNLHPILQKRTAGGWTRGRKVSLERLYNQHNEAEFAFLTDQDIAICRSLQAETARNHYGYTETTYSFDSLRAARAIVGHPCIFRESDRENPIEIVEQEPHLVVTKTKDKRIAVSLTPSPSKTRDDDFRIANEGAHRLAFVFFNEQHRALHEILGDQLVVPESAAERVMKTVQSVASLVAVHSEIGAGDSAGEAVAGEPRPHLHLLPYHAGLQVKFYVRPFGDDGPYFPPGEGAETVVAKIGEQTQTARRDLQQERMTHAEVVAACPSIAAQADSGSISFATAAEALEMLLELEELVAAGKITLHWPQGRSLQLAGLASGSQFRLNIKKDRDWFAASGQLKVDKSLSLDLMRMIELVEASRRLKQLIQPFILRRTKSQVLDELPSRTEITLKVELSDEEAAFYEALRQRAVEKLSEADDDRPQHLRILAELMRLRRACCHPRLVMEDSEIGSSKLALFVETLDELLDNKHKVLVFSQFVDHLTVIRQQLDDRGVSYQYLDGSTPAKQRKQHVEAFQSGAGDVFLISLRAGGLGLNLTAADYVIHLDPWWNPAVEDQASDRAHRLGQQRPVTIYRLITRGTIEERITDLHCTKRDLADSLLEGTDLTGKLSAAELLKLIRE